MAVTDAFRFLRAPALAGRFSLDAWLARWHEALIACLPPSGRRVLSGRDQRLVLVPDGAAARLCRQQGQERQLVAELERGAPDSLHTVIGGLRGARHRAAIELPAGQVLTRSVSFPVQVRDNLPKVMGYEIDRITPFRSDQVYFDFRLRDGMASREKISVELVICRRDRVQGWLQRLREAGIPAEQLTWEGAWPRANLLPPQEQPQRRGGFFGLNRLLFLAVLLLAGGMLATPLWQKTRVLEDLDAELGDFKARAEKVHEMRVALEQARAGSVAVLQHKREQPRMIDLLRELTEQLPDNTWVQNLDVQGNEVQLRGESSQATALIGLLEKAPGISDVAFRSPVVQVAATGQERFHISLKYTREVLE